MSADVVTLALWAVAGFSVGTATRFPLSWLAAKTAQFNQTAEGK